MDDRHIENAQSLENDASGVRSPRKGGGFKEKFPTVIIVIIFLIGVALLLYPTISSLWNSRVSTRAIKAYTSGTATLTEEERLALIEEAREYNASLVGKAGRFTLSEDEEEEYNSLLSVPGTNVIGYIEIDKINVSLPIYHGTGSSSLSNGVGHLEGSSLPVGGESTHCVLSGHRGLVSATLFTNLDQMEIGDTFVITVLGMTLTYEVDQIVVVEPDDLSEIQIVEGEDYVTLLTCTPYGINSHRLLVRGHRIENAEEDTSSSHLWLYTLQIIMLIAAVVLILIFIIVMRRNRKKVRR